VAVLPEDIVSRATLIVIASVLCASTEGGPVGPYEITLCVGRKQRLV
jgi:hypothetical protein